MQFAHTWAACVLGGARLETRDLRDGNEVKGGGRLAGVGADELAFAEDMAFDRLDQSGLVHFGFQIERRVEGEYNIGSDDPPTVRDMLQELCRRAGSRSRLFPLPVGLTQAALATLWTVRLSPMNPAQFLIAPEDYVLDTSRAKQELGWQPTRGDTESMHATYEWYVSGAPS